jgi:hypothetical protein
MGRAPKFKNVFPKTQDKAFGKTSHAGHIQGVTPM